MLAVCIVAMRPGANYDPSVCKIAEHGHVEQLVMHTTIEAFNKPVLLRFTRRKVVPTDLAL